MKEYIGNITFDFINNSGEGPIPVKLVLHNAKFNFPYIYANTSYFTGIADVRINSWESLKTTVTYSDDKIIKATSGKYAIKKNIEKIPDTDGSQHHHCYCPQCHFLFGAFGLLGSNFCPNCGTKIDWGNNNFKENLDDWMRLSVNHYQRHKERNKIISEDVK